MHSGINGGILILLVASIFSCNCQYGASGNVYESESKEPVDSVLVTSNFAEDDYVEERYTNFQGYFSAGSRGWPCEEVRVLFQKEGYETQTIFVPKGEVLHGLSIYMPRK